jgi:hypothetical protein|tara:strand:+ start:67 stop:288 length:222 start_codon:yes stop_codon:yes gene_type:complete
MILGNKIGQAAYNNLSKVKTSDATVNKDPVKRGLFSRKTADKSIDLSEMSPMQQSAFYVKKIKDIRTSMKENT